MALRLTSRLVLAPLLVAFVLVSACSSDDAGDPDAGTDADTSTDPPRTDPWMEVGTGVTEFEALTEGQEIPIVQGPQGGFHVWGGLQGFNFEPDNAEISYVLIIDGETVADALYYDDIPRVRDRYEYSRVAVVLFDEIDPESISGQTATLALRLRTADGGELTDQIDVVPICCER